MAKKKSRQQAAALVMEPESDDYFAYIAGYTSGGAPYGITWEEQEELDRRVAVRASAIPPEQKEPVSLHDIVARMQFVFDETTVYYQRSTGKFITVADGYLYADEPDHSLEDGPEGEQKGIRVTAEFLAGEDEGDNVSLPDRYDLHHDNIMKSFCPTVNNPKIAKELSRSLIGRKAFRRFKEVLHRHGIETSWYEFRDEAYKAVGLLWCEQRGIRWRE
jgi:Uncharacterised protein family (UPF0158)